jgi:acetoacetate decarboxylase
MAYPQAPWTLCGYGIQTLHLVDIDRVQAIIPSSLKIISVLPGKTVGGIYIASYGDGSTLVYNELIVVSAIVHLGIKIGGWISHIYVDHSDSIAGGRNIWGLPKEKADFSWKSQNPLSVSVQQDGRSLCTLSSDWQLPGWQQSVSIPIISKMDSQLLLFDGQAGFKFHLTNADLIIPDESPFAWLNFDRPHLSFYCNPLQLIANPPTPLHEKSS